MSKVIAGFSMSLDGFIADPDDGVEHVFKWYSAGGTDAEVMAGDHATGMTREAAEFIERADRGAGVLVTARRTFDSSSGPTTRSCGCSPCGRGGCHKDRRSRAQRCRRAVVPVPGRGLDARAGPALWPRSPD